MIEAIFVEDSEYSKVKLKQFEKLQCLIPKTLPTPSCEKIVLPGKYEAVPNHAHCGNCRNSLSHFFRKNFVKATVLLKKLLNS